MTANLFKEVFINKQAINVDNVCGTLPMKAGCLLK
jgi:hypothetical protein